MIGYLCKSLRIIILVWPTRLIFLAMGEVLSFGFNLAVLGPNDRKGTETYCIVAIEDKKMGFISYCMSLSLYIMSSCLKCYSVLCELNSLDAGRSLSMYGVIVVDAGRSRSTCLRSDAYIHDHCLGYCHNYALSINCAIIICSPTVLKEICPRGNNKVVIYISLYHDKCLLFMLELY